MSTHHSLGPSKSKTCHLQSRDRFELICNRLEKVQPLHSSLQKTRLKPCIAWRTRLCGPTLQSPPSCMIVMMVIMVIMLVMVMMVRLSRNFMTKRCPSTGHLTSDSSTNMPSWSNGQFPSTAKSSDGPGETLHDVKMERHTLEAPALSLEPQLRVCLVNSMGIPGS